MLELDNFVWVIFSPVSKIILTKIDMRETLNLSTSANSSTERSIQQKISPVTWPPISIKKLHRGNKHTNTNIAN